MTRKEFFAQLDLYPPFDQYMTSKLHNLLRDGFEASTPNIIGIAKGESDDASPAVQVRAHNNLGRYAMAKNHNIVLENREWLATVMEITADVFPDREKLITWTSLVFAALNTKLAPEDMDG